MPQRIALFLIVLLSLIQVQGFSQHIVINEVMASNSRVLSDKYGAFEDWIELYNAGDEPVNLQGYGLSDDAANPFKWVFPSFTLMPDSFLIVWASGKDIYTSPGSFVNGIYRNYYQQIPGTTVEDLITHTSFPGKPTIRDILPKAFETPTNFAENYGQQLYTWINPPITGEYTFWVSGRDQCQLYLSTSEDPEDAELIAHVPEHTNPRQWNKYPEQRSEKIFLEAEKRYYLSAYMKQGMGIDNLAVMWMWPDNHLEVPLSAEHCYVPAGNMHTNFRIAAAGENILLTAPGGELVDETGAVPIPSNSSYGRTKDGGGDWAWFDEPTPGLSNNSMEPFEGIHTQPAIVPDGGIYSTPVEVQLLADDDKVDIYYTWDGSLPCEDNGILYTGPFEVDSTVYLRAIATGQGRRHSAVAGAGFTMLDEDLQDFSSNLPVMVIHQYDTLITPGRRSSAFMMVADQTGDGRTNLSIDPVFKGRANINIRGSTSQDYYKKGYGIHLLEEDHSNRKVSLLGMPEEHNWVLHGPYSDKTLIRNALSYSLSNDMGQYAPRTRLLELFLHDGNGPLSNDSYVGVYLLVERIKIAPGRVDIHKLEPHHNDFPEVSGGYIFKKDGLSLGEFAFRTQRNSFYVNVRPNVNDISRAQHDYLVAYLDTIESVLFGPDFNDPEAGYTNYLDIPSFIDYHLIQELLRNIDGFKKSTFFYKDRGGKLIMGPMWDMNLALGNAYYQEGWNPVGWQHATLSQPEYMYGWYTRLFADESFADAYKERYRNLRSGVFSNSYIRNKIEGYYELLNEAQVRNFERWRILGGNIWPNYFIGATYEEEVEWMTDWIMKRLAWMDEQLDVGNLPPVQTRDFDRPVELFEGGDPLTIYLDHFFEDPAGEELEYIMWVDQPAILNIVQGDQGHLLRGTKAGSTKLNILVSDGFNPPLSAEMNILVYPEPWKLSENDFLFDFWSPDEPEGSFPPSMIFLQTNETDPVLTTPLLDAYHIPEDEYAEEDAEHIGFPYRNTRRTRINGLGTDGISLINTGRDRDLGAVVLSLNTEGLEGILLDWKASTLLANSRVYHLRLQYRTGLNMPWNDWLDDDGYGLEYKRNSESGHVESFEQISLPDYMLNKSGLQIRWFYYYTGERLSQESGARDMLALNKVRLREDPYIGINHPLHPEIPLAVYPNPSSGRIVHLNKPVTGMLLDVYGRVAKHLDGAQTIHVSSLPAGLFFVRTLEGEVVKLVVTDSL